MANAYELIPILVKIAAAKKLLDETIQQDKKVPAPHFAYL
jgi:hypothetical protein